MSPQGVTTLRFVVSHEALFFDPKTMAISVAMRSGSAATPDLKLAQSVAGCFRSLTIYMGGTLVERINEKGRSKNRQRKFASAFYALEALECVLTA